LSLRDLDVLFLGTAIQIPFHYSKLSVFYHKLLQAIKRGWARALPTSTIAVVQVLTAVGAKPLAVLMAERLHGEGEKDLFLYDSPQGDVLSIVRGILEILRCKLEILGLDPIRSCRTKHLAQVHVHGMPKRLQAPAALELEGRVHLALDEDVRPALLDKQTPPGGLLDFQTLQALPRVVPAAEFDA
jgi:hypothetical protein